MDELLPVITSILNLSLQSGYFAEEWKEALVHPLLKKCGLELNFKNLRPVSNLTFISKLTESAAAYQMQSHMSAYGLYPILQSSYRKHHSTETALLKVHNDILMNMNKQHVTLLVLLDLSAAFDTVSHDILLTRLQSKLGVRGTVLSWFESYLSGRSQRVSVNGSVSNSFHLECGVPQGSCLGPLLFNIYASKLFDIINRHLPDVHCYADDSQLYLSFSPKSCASQEAAINSMECCVDDIKNWMCSDKLMLNDEKTEFIVIGTRQQLSKVKIDHIRVGDCEIAPVASVRNLGGWFDAKFSMATHITKMCGTAFYQLHNISRIRKYLSQDAAETLIHSFITSRVDYCNSLLYGVPAYQLEKLQRVQNAAARLIFMEHKFCHITPLLLKLHWLPIRFRINFKILLITFKAIHGLAPSYIMDLISIKSSAGGRYALRSNKGLLLNPLTCKTYTTLGDRAFMASAPKLWNALPVNIRNVKTVDNFKKCLKFHLFGLAYNNNFS